MDIGEELKTYLRVLGYYMWMIVSCAIIASMVALGISLILTPRYSAMATLRVASAPGGVSDYTYTTSSTQLSNTYVDIATSDTSLNEVVKRLGLLQKPSVQVAIVPETELIRITATDPDPVRARDIANTLATLLVEQSMQLYGGNGPTAAQVIEGQLQQAKVDLDNSVSDYDKALRASQSSVNPVDRSTQAPNPDVDRLAHLVSVRQQIYSDLLQSYQTARTSEELRANAITVVETASLPLKPSTPNKLLNSALGLAAGLTLGVILAFLFEGMDDTVRGVEDVQALTSLLILCRIPELKRMDRFPKGDNPPLLAFDQLSTRLILFDAKPKSTTYLLTSPEPGAGKSTIIANLAVSLAQGGNRVVLVDMDFRHPSQHSILDLPNESGLSNFLRGEIQLDETLQTTKWPNLRVVTAGSSLNVPFEWLTPLKISSLLEVIRYECDYVLIDAPALLSVAESLMVASQTDGVIMVAARRGTERQNLRFALQQLAEIKARVVGIVVNKVPNSQMYNYYSRRNTGNSSQSNMETTTDPLAVDAQSKGSNHYEE